MRHKFYLRQYARVCSPEKTRGSNQNLGIRPENRLSSAGAQRKLLRSAGSATTESFVIAQSHAPMLVEFRHSTQVLAGY